MGVEVTLKLAELKEMRREAKALREELTEVRKIGRSLSSYNEELKKDRDRLITERQMLTYATSVPDFRLGRDIVALLTLSDGEEVYRCVRVMNREVIAMALNPEKVMMWELTDACYATVAHYLKAMPIKQG